MARGQNASTGRTARSSVNDIIPPPPAPDPNYKPPGLDLTAFTRTTAGETSPLGKKLNDVFEKTPTYQAKEKVFSTSSTLFEKPAPAGLKGFEIERWNRNNKDAQERFAMLGEITKSSKTDKEFFEKLGERVKTSDSGNYVVQTGILYNGNLDGKGRAEQFLTSVKEGLKEGTFGDKYREAKVTFKGSRKDEIRIDFPEGTELPKRSELRNAVRNLGRSMTQTQTEYYGDGFGYTSMPQVSFRVGGKVVDSLDYI